MVQGTHLGSMVAHADSTFDSGQGSTVYSDSQSSQQSVVLGSLADGVQPPAQCVCSPPVSVSDGPILPHSLPSLGAYQQPAVQPFPEPAMSFAPGLPPPSAPVPPGPGQPTPPAHQPPHLTQPVPLPQVLAPQPVGPLQPVPPNLPPYLAPASQVVAPAQLKPLQMPPAPLQPLAQVPPQTVKLPHPPGAPLAVPCRTIVPNVAATATGVPLLAVAPQGVAALSIHPTVAQLPAQPVYPAAFPQMVPSDVPPSPLHAAQTVRAAPHHPAPPMLPQPHKPSVARLAEQAAPAASAGSQILLGHPPPYAVDVTTQVPTVPTPAAVLSPPLPEVLPPTAPELLPQLPGSLAPTLMAAAQSLPVQTTALLPPANLPLPSGPGITGPCPAVQLTVELAPEEQASQDKQPSLPQSCESYGGSDVTSGREMSDSCEGAFGGGKLEGKAARKHHRRSTRARSRQERASRPRLTILNVCNTGDKMVECQLETHNHKMVTFKFDLDGDAPDEIATYMVEHDFILQAERETFIEQMKDVMDKAEDMLSEDTDVDHGSDPGVSPPHLSTCGLGSGEESRQPQANAPVYQQNVLHTGKRWFIICPVAEHPAAEAPESSPPLPLSSLQPDTSQGMSSQNPSNLPP
ncbi:hypothetical protein J1605_007790 [Eschrichtius robustus]|uniref:Serine/threonine-protein kinase WNK CCTL2 domain-containing protein n=1 Tax=Eschrichtius robustus TaxID=9764 RepID=A0AB34GZN3_ESCRO|nr:hypothetical protein J1605_007790 [Eschrichtius robustus]